MSRRIGVNESRWFNKADGVNYGYIILPSNYSGDINRKKYISNCYRRERVSILPERGGTPSFDCMITRSALRDIYFPSSPDRLGSGIIFITDSATGQPVVIGVVSKMDETSLMSENVFNESRTFGDSSISIQMDPSTGQLVISNKNSNKPAVMKINISNLTKDCELDIGVSGKISVTSEGGIYVKSNTSVTSEVKGSKITLEEGSANISSPKIDLIAGKASVTIENDKISIKNQVEDLKTILSDLITQIENITVLITDPVSGPLTSGKPINSAVIGLISQRLQSLLS